MNFFSGLARRFYRWLGTLSGFGIALGLLLFAFSLTPSLIPRSLAVQGALAGLCLTAGHAAGALCRFVWKFLGFRQAVGRARRIPNAVILTLCLVIVIYCLWKAADWQNGVRAAMNLAPIASIQPIKLCLIALVVYLAFLGLGYLVGAVFRFLSLRSKAVLPPRAAILGGLVATAVLFWSLGSDVLVGSAFRVADASLRQVDALIEPDRARPTDPDRTGSDASLVKWEDLGRMGRRFVAGAPTAVEIEAVTRRSAKQPLRIYVGLNAAETAEERAKLAFDELMRVRGFERKTLVIATPTGTGWVDAAAMDSLEYLQDGDVSTVAVQYSYLSSPLALLAGPEQESETAVALFRQVYRYWRTLPRETRPRLYLHGLSLGSLNSENSMDPFETIGDPINGALWSGPPFANRTWGAVTADRNPGTPVWLPQFRDGSVFRFMNQAGSNTPAGTPWGPMRVVYLQYASDAITFFDFQSLYRQPDWMKAPRGPDVSKDLRWFPFVTMLQLALDMAVANGAPLGHGHSYAPDHYLDAWVAVTGSEDRPSGEIAAIKKHLIDEARAEAGDKDGSYGGRGG